jgi:hypothetical protein
MTNLLHAFRIWRLRRDLDRAIARQKIIREGRRDAALRGQG